MDTAKTKNECLKLLSKGLSQAEAMKILGKSRNTINYYMETDADFRRAVELVRVQLSGEQHERTNAVPPFDVFCRDYLFQPLTEHQLRWWDVLEGREPRNLHPRMVWEPGDPGLCLFNTPPGFAKSTALTMNWVTYQICCNPNIAVIIVARNEELARQFLSGIKLRLTANRFRRLQEEFGPPGGFASKSDSWTQTKITISPDARDTSEKDPTVQALGMGGRIQGARANLIILDDIVTTNNARDYEKQIEWIEQEVDNRLYPTTEDPNARIIVVGTRMAAKDLYSELRAAKPADDDDDEAAAMDEDGTRYGWTYLSQPAVLEFADDPKDWVTLWPQRFPGKILARKKRNIRVPSRWARLWQQEQVSNDTTFKLDDIQACQQGRKPGIIPSDAPRLGREMGMAGLRIIAGIDPARAGFTAACCYGLDMKTGDRYVIDQFNKARCTPDEMRKLIYDWTVKYGVKEWRIEDNAFQDFFATDPEVTQWCAARGVAVHGHTTGRNKSDPNFGVAAMQSLFTQRLIHLPQASSSAVRALVDQLSVWEPDLPKGVKTDCVMSLWFCELRALELWVASTGDTAPFQNNSIYRTKSDLWRQHTIDLIEDGVAA